jgi:hypothetical protein
MDKTKAQKAELEKPQRLGTPVWSQFGSRISKGVLECGPGAAKTALSIRSLWHGPSFLWVNRKPYPDEMRGLRMDSGEAARRRRRALQRQAIPTNGAASKVLATEKQLRAKRESIGARGAR